MARKKQKGEMTVNADWMTSFSDMMTLLLTFFVLLYSFSTIDLEKFQAMAASFGGSATAVVPPLNPGGSIAPSAADQFEQEGVDPKEDEEKAGFDNLYNQIMTYRDENDLDSVLMVERMEDTILLRFLDSMLFDSASADLRPESQELLTTLYGLFEQTIDEIKVIRTEGHSDNLPIKNSIYRDNWDLSCYRASSVVRFISDNIDIDPSKLTAAGYGEFHPIDTNETPEGRAKNRRVDIVVERKIEVTEEGEIIYPDDIFNSERTQRLWDETNP